MDDIVSLALSVVDFVGKYRHLIFDVSLLLLLVGILNNTMGTGVVLDGIFDRVDKIERSTRSTIDLSRIEELLKDTQRNIALSRDLLDNVEHVLRQIERKPPAN